MQFYIDLVLPTHPIFKLLAQLLPELYSILSNYDLLKFNIQEGIDYTDENVANIINKKYSVVQTVMTVNKLVLQNNIFIHNKVNKL